MRKPVSKRIQSLAKAITGENKYFDNLLEKQAYLQSIKQAMNSPFGEELMKALDTVESAAFETLYNSNFKHKIAQAKAEIKIARYLKSILSSFIVEEKQVTDTINHFREEEMNGEA